MNYLVAFIGTAVLAAIITPLVRRYALRRGIVDRPSDPRKIHRHEVAYLGGVAIFVAFAVMAIIMLPASRQFFALLVGCSVLVVVGAIDDIRGLSPWTKLIWQIVAAVIALAGGIGITQFTNPFGGVIMLDQWRFAVHLGTAHFHIAPVANLFSLIWMVGLTNTINFLDGLDGLAGGVSGIAALIMFLIAVGPRVMQPQVALLAIILAGAAFGWLPFNFYPARIFMGDSGAYFLGLALAMLAIYSGGKLATAGLGLGVPILDTLWAVVRRLWRRTSPFRADRGHFHHLLIDVGLSQRSAVLTLYAVSAAFGVVALFAGSLAKLIALIVLSVLMASLIALLITISLRRTVRASK